jgi:hypothetical protein
MDENIIETKTKSWSHTESYKQLQHPSGEVKVNLKLPHYKSAGSYDLGMK